MQLVDSIEKCASEKNERIIHRKEETKRINIIKQFKND